MFWLLERNDFLPVSRDKSHFLLFCVAAYEIATTTGHAEDASTTENAWMILEGRKARSKEFVLENKKKKFLRSVFKESLASSTGSWTCGVISFLKHVFYLVAEPPQSQGDNPNRRNTRTLKIYIFSVIIEQFSLIPSSFKHDMSFNLINNLLTNMKKNPLISN